MAFFGRDYGFNIQQKHQKENQKLQTGGNAKNWGIGSCSAKLSYFDSESGSGSISLELTSTCLRWLVPF